MAIYVGFQTPICDLIVLATLLLLPAFRMLNITSRIFILTMLQKTKGRDRIDHALCLGTY